MKDIPWISVIELLRFWGYVVITIGFFKLCGTIIEAVWSGKYKN